MTSSFAAGQRRGSAVTRQDCGAVRCCWRHADRFIAEGSRAWVWGGKVPFLNVLGALVASPTFAGRG